MTKPAWKMRRLTAVALCAALADPCGLGVALARATELQGVEVSPDALTIKTSGEVKYSSFVTADPPRVVVELLDTTVARRARSTFPGQGKLLTRVREGQFAMRPKPVSRVVLYLTRPSDYRIIARGDSLLVRLADKDAADLKDSPAETALLAQNSPPLHETMPAESDMSAPDTEPPPAPRPPSEPAARPARRSTDILDQLPGDIEDFHADNMDIGDVFRLLGQTAHINIVYGPDVHGSVTLHLTQVPFRDIFRTVLNMQGLVTEQVGDRILRVMTPDAYQAALRSAVPQTKVFTLSYAKATDIRQQLDTIRTTEGRRGSTGIDPTSNSVIVTDSPDGIEEAARIIASLDRRPQQVLIEAKLMEVTLTKQFSEGIQWGYSGTNTNNLGGVPGTNLFGTALSGYSQNVGSYLPNATPTSVAGNVTTTGGVGGSPSTGLTGVNLPSTLGTAGSFVFGRITNDFYLNAQISALATSGKAKVLSNPRVATLNNQRAVIAITDQYPYVTTSLTSGGVSQQNVGFTTTGITLTVTPTINADGHITLVIIPEVSVPGAVNAATGATGANTRHTETTVLVRDGETIVIGGLISDQIDNSTSEVPLLGDIPLIGWLFKSSENDRTRDELLVFVTTRIMPD